MKPLRQMSPAGAPKNQKPKIPKGFVLINLSATEEKQLRDLCRECEGQLRTVLKYAVRQVKGKLEEWVRIKRLTGFSLSEQTKFFNPRNPSLN